MQSALRMLILFLFLVLVAQGDEIKADKPIPTMKVAQVANGMIYKADRYKAYHILNLEGLDKKFLFFTVSVDQIYKHLELSLFIYKEGSQTPLQKCEKDEVDSCYLSRNLLEINEALFIVIQSDNQEELTYKIRAYWSDLQHINLNEEVKFMFSETEQRQVYHLELEGKQFKELRIIIKPVTRRYVFDRVKMYGTFGTDSQPTSSNYNFKSFPLWEDAEGVYLFRDEIKDLNMNLILYGVTETIYTMRCEIVNATHNDVILDSKIYEYLENEERYMYHVNFKDNNTHYPYDQYILRMSTFSGDLYTTLYKDLNKKEPITEFKPAMYLGDIQYLFSKEQIEKIMPNGLYLEVFSVKRISTFFIEFQGRNIAKPLELHENIYQFLEIDKQKKAFFNIGKFGTKDTNKTDSLDFTFTEVAVTGRIKAQFRACNKPQQVCMGENFTELTTKLQYTSGSIGQKNTFTVQLPHSLFSNVNVVQQNVIIVVVLNNVDDSKSFSAVEYSVGQRVQFLREGKPMESAVMKEQMKIYKYICKDPLVKKVRIHLNTLFGTFNAFLFRNVPSEEELRRSKGIINGSLIEITERITDDPIVVVIHGNDFATFSIIVQPIVKDSEAYSFITLSEDVQFKAKVAPNQFQIFEIVPIQGQIYYNYKATGALHACRLNDDWVCSEDKLPDLSNKGNITIEKFFDRKAYIKVRNPSSDRTVEVSSVFHSKKEEHCELMKLGELSNLIVEEGKCLYTVLPELEDYEVMVVHDEFRKFAYKMVLCDKMLSFAHNQNDEEKYVLTKQTITENCKEHDANTFTIFVAGDLDHWSEGKIQNSQNVKIKFIVQKVNSIITLPDGVGYKSKAESTELPIKKFSYHLLNKVDTNIVLTTRANLYFLVKVVESKQKNTVQMSMNDYHFSSSVDRLYFLESLFLKIDGGQFLKNQCDSCDLLIFVYSKEPVGQVIDFTIEVSQNFIHLEDGVARNNYLMKDSMAYYGYETRKKGFVLVELSDNNANCAEIYISHNEFPDENNYGQRSFDGQLMLQNTNENPKTYYISVKAKTSCSYSISANLIQDKNVIKKLERGTLRRLSMKEGQVQYYTFTHKSQTGFKILSLHRYGNVRFFLNKTTHEAVASIMKGQKIQSTNFQYESHKKNRLYLDTHHKMFCKDCIYILCVVARKVTESSLFLGDSETKIPISQEKIINDILPQIGSSSYGEFYPIEKGYIEVKTHSGELEVKVTYKNQQFKTTFTKGPEPSIYNFTIDLVKGYYGTASIKMTALSANTVYSMKIKSFSNSQEEDTEKKYVTINPNEANYLYIANKPTCLKGFLKGRDQNLFLSFYSNEREIINNVSITAKLNGSDTPVSSDITRNVMSISFVDAPRLNFDKAAPFEVCFEVKDQPLSAAVMQTQETSMLPDNMEILVTGKKTYDIYPEGQFLLDVFECRGSATVAYGATPKELQEKKEHLLDSIGMPDQPHAVKVNRGYSNLLVSVNSPLALIRWMPINQEDQKGIGYYLYAAGSLKYESEFRQLSFTIEPIKFAKKSIKTKTKIVNIKYNLYISDNEDDLKEASLCERYLPGSVLEYNTIHEQMYPNPFKFPVRKNNIMEKYKDAKNLFAVIVADLSLETPDKQQEYYRFVYNQQQIPADLFVPSKIEEFNLGVIIVVLVLILLVLFVFACLCKTVFVPMLGRLKNRMLVEDHGLENSRDKDGNQDEPVPLEPPPSSDRQGINNDMRGPETEERMK